LFGEALGRSHHGGRSDGFVGRNQDNAGIVRGCGGDERFGGEDVVGEGGEGLFFHEWNVLVGGGVEDKARAVEGKDLVEEAAIGDAAEIEVRVVNGAGKILLEIVEVVFRGFEENGGRSRRGETERECGADGAACTGDEDWVLNE
jgi:hypothetical protein